MYFKDFFINKLVFKFYSTYLIRLNEIIKHFRIILSKLFTFFFLVFSRCEEGSWVPSVKTLRSHYTLPFPRFYGHCVFSEGTQRRVLPRYQREKVKILNIFVSQS